MSFSISNIMHSLKKSMYSREEPHTIVPLTLPSLLGILPSNVLVQEKSALCTNDMCNRGVETFLYLLYKAHSHKKVLSSRTTTS